MASFYLILFLLFFLPIIVLPIGTSYFELPKVILAEIGIELLVFFAIIKKGFLNLKQFNQTQLIPAITLILLTLIHLLWFKTTTIFFGNAFRLQGIFLLWHLVIF